MEDIIATIMYELAGYYEQHRLDLDSGKLRMVTRGDCTITLGLFPRDPKTGEYSKIPSKQFTIEVTQQL